MQPASISQLQVTPLHFCVMWGKTLLLAAGFPVLSSAVTNRKINRSVVGLCCAGFSARTSAPSSPCLMWAQLCGHFSLLLMNFRMSLLAAAAWWRAQRLRVWVLAGLTVPFCVLEWASCSACLESVGGSGVMGRQWGVVEWGDGKLSLGQCFVIKAELWSQF